MRRPDRQPPSSKVDVWFANCDVLRCHPDECRQWLDERERSHLEQYGCQPGAIQYLAAHANLRLLLGNILDQHPAALTFQYNRWGKPELLGGPQFNLSHAGAWALVAIDDYNEIGIDVETSDRRIIPPVADFLLSQEEARRLSDDAMSQERLLRVWVRKEAVLKAFGTGLSVDPNRFVVGCGPPNYRHSINGHLIFEEDSVFFSFIDIELPFAAYACVARLRSDDILPPRIRQMPAWCPACS